VSSILELVESTPESRIAEEVKAMVAAYDQAVAECERLRAENEALKSTCKQLLQVERYEIVYDEMQEDDEGNWVKWADVIDALRGEGEN
jgi:hypothetical protein